VVPSTVQPDPVLSTLPDPSKGGQQVLKLFIAVQNRLAIAKEEHGQTMAEYGVVLAVITIGIVVALTALAGGINGALTKVTGKL